MGRNATITIENKTGYALRYTGCTIQHGKFNQDPPDTIQIGESAAFQVGNRTGAKIGPQGTARYAVVGFSSKTLPSLELEFFWNHPFNASTSSYRASSIPSGYCSFSLRPAIPVGHDQSVTITVELDNV